MGHKDTIFAVSSGSAPAAIGIIRVSGPSSATALARLAGREFEPRRATVARLRARDGGLLDEAMVLWFPGPSTATGEDLVELHCHGGRAVLDAVCRELGSIEGLRPAEEGEFTRRAFANGRMDLAQAEALADLLEAETELQRASAIANVSGALSKQVANWREELLRLSAQVEAALDFSDEDDVEPLPDGFTWNLDGLIKSIEEQLDGPRSERLGEGFRVVLAGPPNAGKSTLFNALVESDAAITSSIAGTTRDAIERSVAIHGVPFTFVDTAGLRSGSEDEIEQVGIERAKAYLERADTILWLGPEGDGPQNSWEIAARSDADDFTTKQSARFNVSAFTGEGLPNLKSALVSEAREKLPKPGELAINQRQHERLVDAAAALRVVVGQEDLLLIGEGLRQARVAFDRLIGQATTEDMLDALFGRFCIGK